MSQPWTTIIQPKTKLIDLKLHELWQYRDLIIMFVKRDFKTMYKQTILGPLWIIINPILTTLMQVFVFGNLAGISTDGIPDIVFYMAGNMIWLYFSSCLNKTANTFVGNVGVFGKVYFPRLVTPISIIISGMIMFVVRFCIFMVFIVYFRFKGLIEPNITIMLLPLYILILAMLSMGCGIVISALTTKYRDLSILVNFGIQLWMYGSAIIFPVSSIPEKWGNLLMLNPIVPIVEAFRYSFTGKGVFSVRYLGIAMIVTVVLLLIGCVIFNKVEKTFLDTV